MNTPPYDENSSAKSGAEKTLPSPTPSGDEPTEALDALDARRIQQQVQQQFGRYRVVQLLGQGGFGAVYSAVDEQFDRQAAFKVTSAQRLGSQARDQFLIKARIVAALEPANFFHQIASSSSDIRASAEGTIVLNALRRPLLAPRATLHIATPGTKDSSKLRPREGLYCPQVVPRETNVVQ